MMTLAPWLRVFLTTLGYTMFGIIIFGVAFWAMVLIAPFSLRKEIEQDQNIALAVLMAAVILGLSIIIGATIHG